MGLNEGREGKDGISGKPQERIELGSMFLELSSSHLLVHGALTVHETETDATGSDLFVNVLGWKSPCCFNSSLDPLLVDVTVLCISSLKILNLGFRPP